MILPDPIDSSPEEAAAHLREAALLRHASTWALLAHRFHDSPLGVPYAEAIQAELRRRGLLTPLQVVVDILLGVLFFPLALDFTAWPEVEPPGLRDVFLCLVAWVSMIGLVLTGFLATLALLTLSLAPLLMGLLILVLSNLPLGAVVVVSWFSSRHSPRRSTPHNGAA